jgi:hypothetical protein
MTARKRHPIPGLDKLEGWECNRVLTELLAVHPELTEDAEHIALALLADIDADEVADSIEAELRAADLDQLALRAGRVRGRGYVHENEAAAEILEELLQPALNDLARRASLDLGDAAGRIGLGLLRGISRCRDVVEMGTVLAYAGPDVVDDLAQSVELATDKLKVPLPADPP